MIKNKINSEYNKIKSSLVAKGYEIVGGANFYDYDDDSEYFPNFKFNFVL